MTNEEIHEHTLERLLMVNELMGLNKEQIQEFLSRHGLPISGTKPELRARVEGAIEADQISLYSIAKFLDEVVPWGKQHVYLYRGPSSSIAAWKDTKFVAARLKQYGLDDLLNARVTVLLPLSLQLSSIAHTGHHLRITAIQRREWWEPRPEENQEGSVANDGLHECIEYRAFVRKVVRNLVAFEWDLRANQAMLQISQLNSAFRYEDVAREFFELTSRWLNRSHFEQVDLRPTIKRLHELEDAGRGETRSHGINYRMRTGKQIQARSGSRSDSLLGDEAVDEALRTIRNSGVGQLGNFYWLPPHGKGAQNNPLDREVHTIIVGENYRVNFMAPNSESAVRYVLSRIRYHCREGS